MTSEEASSAPRGRTSLVARSAAALRGGTLRRLVGGPAKAMLRSVLPHLVPTVAHPRPAAADPIRIVGMLSSSSGLGMSARLCAENLSDAGFRIQTSDVSSVFAADDGIAFSTVASGAACAMSIYHLNPPKLLPAIVRSGILRHQRSFSVGYWAWELESLPQDWIAGLRYVDAVMAPSSFCQKAIAAYTDKPVIVVPHPVRDAAVMRDETRAGDGIFKVLTIFSYGSSMLRKNPAAAIEAFRKAFSDRKDVHFLLKITRAKAYPTEHTILCQAASGLANVSIVDEIWSQATLETVLASSNAYISLHRSEGFGLTLAEAIMAGVPVVATDWSGNTDFCNRDLTYPVDYRLVPFRDDHPDFRGVEGAVWAEPSVDHAASQLRRIFDAPDDARRRAVLAREELRRYLRTRTYAEAIAMLVQPDDRAPQ